MRYQQHEQKEAIKEEIFSQLTDEELQIVPANSKDIYWEEEEKEFVLFGEMYDVVRSKTVNDVVLLYCINDKNEKALVDSYNTVTKHNSSTDKKGKNTIDNSISLYMTENESLIHTSFSLTQNIFISFDSRLAENVTGNISPPPKA